MVVVGATVTGDTENGYTVTANDGITILNISTELDTTINIVGDLTEVTVNTPNAHIVVPAGTTVTTINALSVSESSLEIRGTVNEIVIKSEKTIRIYGAGVTNLTITNGLETGSVKVILPELGNEEIVIEQDEEVKIDDDGEIVVEEPEEDNKAPEVAVKAPTTLIKDEDSLTIEFEVKDDSELAFLEIDHSLGKHSGTPEEEQLPEFKLYPTDNPWGTEEGKNLAASLGVAAEYDEDSTTWTLTFGEGAALDQIKEQTEFKVYYVVEDVHGNAFGSMSPTRPENTVVIKVEEPADTTKPRIEDANLVIDGKALLVMFSIDETIDLNTEADVKLSYFVRVDSEWEEMKNSLDGNKSLVKDKTWAGYLANVNGPAKNYSSGSENEPYDDVIEVNTLIGSKVQRGYRLDESMDYVEITDFSAVEGEYAVDIIVIDNAGNVSKTERVEVIVTP